MTTTTAPIICQNGVILKEPLQRKYTKQLETRKTLRVREKDHYDHSTTATFAILHRPLITPFDVPSLTKQRVIVIVHVGPSRAESTGDFRHDRRHCVFCLCLLVIFNKVIADKEMIAVVWGGGGSFCACLLLNEKPVRRKPSPL